MSARMRIVRLAEGSRTFYARLQAEGTIRELPGDPESGWGEPFPVRPVGALDWLPPCTPSKIVAVGCNYRAHISELQRTVPEEPLLFMKPPSSLLPSGGTIRLPPQSRRVDYEGELGIVIGRRARCVPADRALDHVLGYTCLNDVTARDLQEKDVQFTRAKGFDSFCPVGPSIVTGLDPESLRVTTFVNGQRRQSAQTSEMIFGVSRLISYISGVMTLEPGDLIATGTPEGVGPLRHGDEISVEIEGIGRLVNRVEGPATTEP
jgi:2-keto-4-pentenoate hydratase/2-oxohepta-3-ene-1,7-dioic acid hydratase in catechol pathway